MAKIKKKISFNDWPKFTKKEIKLASDVISSGKVNYWTGNFCKRFEYKFQSYFKLNHAITVANGSVALDAAVNVLNLNKNHEVLVTPRSYVSTASCLQRTPAKIKFVDIDLNTQNISIKSLEKLINKKTKLIICTHLAGWPFDVQKLRKIIGNKKIYIIEDCSQAHGAKIRNKFVGSMGDIAVWSFCNDKIMSTAGEGGMIACKSKNLYKKLWAYKDCGKNHEKIIKKKNNYLFKWVHDFEGTNLRMTELQASIGIEQLASLNNMIKKRFSNLKFIYKNIHKSKIIKVPNLPDYIFHSGYRCYLFAQNKKIRNEFINFLNKKGIDSNQGSCPEIYKEKRFTNKKKYKILVNAKKLGDISIALPCHHLIRKKNLNYMIDIINLFIKKKSDD